jgi:hypothetical protein
MVFSLVASVDLIDDEIWHAVLPKTKICSAPAVFASFDEYGWSAKSVDQVFEHRWAIWAAFKKARVCSCI